MKMLKLLPLAPALVLALSVSGCSKPLQVVVPDGFHGQVTITCDDSKGSARPITVDATGAAAASCPLTRPSIVVLRGGEPAVQGIAPVWEETYDGSLKQVRITVR